MRDLIISIIAVAILICSWLVFYDYSSDMLTDCADVIEYTIIPLVEAENWDESNRQMNALDKDWHKYKKTALLFLDTEMVNEIDCTLAKSIKYVKAEDVSNASGELNSMIEQLIFLNEIDKVNWANIL